MPRRPRSRPRRRRSRPRASKWHLELRFRALRLGLSKDDLDSEGGSVHSAPWRAFLVMSMPRKCWSTGQKRTATSRLWHTRRRRQWCSSRAGWRRGTGGVQVIIVRWNAGWAVHGAASREVYLAVTCVRILRCKQTYLILFGCRFRR